MTIVYSDPVKNARLSVVVAAIDAGGDVGRLVIGTAALAGGVGILVSIPLFTPSLLVAGGAMSLSGLPLLATAAASGVAAKAELRDSTGVVVVSGLSVDEAVGDVIVADLNFVAGEYVTITVGTIQHA